MRANLNSGPWKVGELAKITGITVRTLHHYDEIELLVPSHHTESGHRLYTAAEVERLQHIVALRHLGFSLEQVREALDRKDFSPLETIKALRREMQQRRIEIDELDERLEGMEELIKEGKAVSTERFLKLIELMSICEKYLTKEQLVKAAEIEKQMGPKRVEEITKVEWPILVGETQAELEKGTNPSDPKVHALAVRWMKLIEEKTAGDAELMKGYGKIIENEPSFGADFMTTMGYPNANLPKLLDYIGKALGAEKN
jgi:MerR family transcriptional regulator, thiopeptide resistance regulator